MFNELFTTENNENVTANARQLSGTAQLTSIAGIAAIAAINQMEADSEKYTEAIQQSTKDMSVLDVLIDELVDFDAMNLEFLSDVDEETVDGMLKSQQSKRSRCKSKAMTLDNYKSMMTAAIAEHILRLVFDKPKTHQGPRSAVVDFTPAELEALEADQEKLRAAIRNIQSKKSIMKSKEGFSEEDERWIALLRAERLLKDLRHGSASDQTRNKLTELIGDVNIDDLKAADAKELLHAIKELLNA